jgi:nicotinamidase/pyrazinamidase
MKPALVVATRDWHWPKHVSFLEQGGPFPTHCIAGTKGAEILPAVDAISHIIFSKGMDPDKEQFSGFDNPMLGPVLHRQIREFDPLYVVGVATEYCVKATALDAVQKYGFTNVVVPLHCIKGIDTEASLAALEEMREAGVKIA